MNDQGQITINLDEFLSIISQLESISVKFDDENIEKNISEINENLSNIHELMDLDELTEEELLQVESLELEQRELNNSIESNLIDLNENIQNLTKIIEEENNTFNELDDLQIKAYGSNIIVMFLLVFAMFARFVTSIFSFFGNKI